MGGIGRDVIYAEVDRDRGQPGGYQKREGDEGRAWQMAPEIEISQSSHWLSPVTAPTGRASMCEALFFARPEHNTQYEALSLE